MTTKNPEYQIFVTFTAKYSGDAEDEPEAFLAAFNELDNLVKQWAEDTYIDTRDVRIGKGKIDRQG